MQPNSNTTNKIQNKYKQRKFMGKYRFRTNDQHKLIIPPKYEKY